MAVPPLVGKMCAAGESQSVCQPRSRARPRLDQLGLPLVCEIKCRTRVSPVRRKPSALSSSGRRASFHRDAVSRTRSSPKLALEVDAGSLATSRRARRHHRRRGMKCPVHRVVPLPRIGATLLSAPIRSASMERSARSTRSRGWGRTARIAARPLFAPATAVPRRIECFVTAGDVPQSSKCSTLASGRADPRIFWRGAARRRQ
jgi:hypothetical protein